MMAVAVVVVVMVVVVAFGGGPSLGCTERARRPMPGSSWRRMRRRMQRQRSRRLGAVTSRRVI
jgi:hypothetical protein